MCRKKLHFQSTEVEDLLVSFRHRGMRDISYTYMVHERRL